MTTIVEVAERAGVSVKTVSRVMNGYTHVSKKTRDKVETAIADLNYAPSIIARQMRLGDTQSIGMLYGDPRSGYQSELNHSMLKACAEVGRYLAVELFDERSGQWVPQVERFLDRTQVRNMVLVPPMCDASELHDLLRSRDVKFVLVSPSRPVTGASSVQMDDRQAAREATDYLIKLGHRRIGHIAGHEDHIVTTLRRLGFLDAIAAAGLDANEAQLILPGRFQFKLALDQARQMLVQKEPPTAIFAANDQMAVAVIMAAHRLGLTVPQDLSVIGFDDTPMCQLIWPTLTTVKQPYDDIAIEAVRLLQNADADRREIARSLILPHELVVRESTAPPGAATLPGEYNVHG